MPQCTHQGHKATTKPFIDSKGKKIPVTLTEGWNPVYRRFETCDVGLIPPRKAGKKKELNRHGGAEAD